MENKSIWSLLCLILGLILSFGYIFDVPAKYVLRSSSLEPYATCLRRFQEHVGDLGQHRPTNGSHTSDRKEVEYAQVGATKSSHADDTFTSCRLALVSFLDRLEVPPATPATQVAIPGAVNRGGGGPGGCSSTDVPGTCLLIANNVAEQNTFSGRDARDGSGSGGCSPTDNPGTCSQQAVINIVDHEASSDLKAAKRGSQSLNECPATCCERLIESMLPAVDSNRRSV